MLAVCNLAELQYVLRRGETHFINAVYFAYTL